MAAARRGFQKQHNDRCVTVFSASNYCGDGGWDTEFAWFRMRLLARMFLCVCRNFGAVIVLSAANFPRYEVFERSP